MPDPHDLIAEAESVHAINPSAHRSFEHHLIAALAEVTHERDEAIAALAEVTHERDVWRTEARSRHFVQGTTFARNLARVTKERDDANALLATLPGGADSVCAKETGGRRRQEPRYAPRPRLSSSECEEIAALRAKGGSVRQIARQVGRHHATVAREIHRRAATRGSSSRMASPDGFIPPAPGEYDT